MNYKVVKEFRRGEPVPADAVYVSSRIEEISERKCVNAPGFPKFMNVVVDSFWIDCYEVPLSESGQDQLSKL